MVGFVGSDGQDDITHHCTVLCRCGRGRGREGEVICRVFIKQDTQPLCIWQSYSALTCSYTHMNIQIHYMQHVLVAVC